MEKNFKWEGPSEELCSLYDGLVKILNDLGNSTFELLNSEFTVPNLNNFEEASKYFELIHEDFDSLCDQDKSLIARGEVFRVYATAPVRSLIISYAASATIVVKTFAKNAAYQLKNNNTLLAYTSLRGLIETIAHFNYVIVTANDYLQNKKQPLPQNEDSMDDYAIYLLGLQKLLLPDIKGSRFKWERAIKAQTVLMNEKQRKKNITSENSEDLIKQDSKSIMASVDLLDKSVIGSRSAYEFLCEFVHPNSAQRMLYTNTYKTTYSESIGIQIDVCGLKNEDITKKVGPEWGMTLEVLTCMLDLIRLFFERSEELARLIKILNKHTQQYVRLAIKAFPIFSPSDPCPCGSTKDIQTCCGKKIRHLLLDSTTRNTLLGIRDR